MFNDTTEQPQATAPTNVQPAPPAVPGAPVSAPVQPKSPVKTGLSLGLKILLIVVGVLVIGGGGFAAYYFTMPDHDQILSQALIKTKDATSFHYKLDVTGNGNYSNSVATPGVVSPSVEADVVFVAEGDYMGKENEKHDFSSDIYFENSKGTYIFEFGAGLKYINEIVYVKFNNLPMVPFIPSENLDMITENWIKLDIPSMKEKYGFEELVDGIKQQRPELNKVLSEQDAEQQKVREELIKAIKEYKIVELANVETIKTSGQKMYKYNLAINKDNFVPGLEAVATALGEEIKPADKKQLEDYLETFKDSSLVLVVGAKDNYIYQSTFTASILNEQGNGEFILNLGLSKFNQVAVVLEPETSVTIEDVLAEVFKPIVPQELPAFLESIPSEFADTDKDGLNNYDEIYFYGTQPTDPDSDGDGYLDGDEVSNGYSPSVAEDKLEPITTKVYFPNVEVGLNSVKGDCNIELEEVDYTMFVLEDFSIVERTFEKLVHDFVGLDQSMERYFSDGLIVYSVDLKGQYLLLDFSQSITDSQTECVTEKADEQLRLTAAQFAGVEYVAILIDGELQKIIGVEEQSSSIPF